MSEKWWNNVEAGCPCRTRTAFFHPVQRPQVSCVSSSELFIQPTLGKVPSCYMDNNGFCPEGGV